MTFWLHSQCTPSSGQQVIFETQRLNQLTTSSKPSDVYTRDPLETEKREERRERNTVEPELPKEWIVHLVL